jgi:protein-disulfide isomerase
VKTYMHAFSCQGARAAEAARLLAGNEAFWKMHDAIFAHQDELDVHQYVRLARQIGLNPARFLEEMNGPRALQRIHAQVDGSAAYDVSSTPAVFLNGRPIRSWNSMAFWQAILEVPAAHPSPTTTTRPSGG